MHKNPLWLIFLAIFSLILIWYTYDAVTKWWTYESMTATTVAESVSFTVEEESSDRYFMRGSYTFEVDGKKIEGESLLQDPMFRNYIAADEAIPKLTNKQWKVWYSPKNPQYSSLQKNYPFKECLYASVLWALLVYFLWLGWRVKHGSSHT